MKDESTVWTTIVNGVRHVLAARPAARLVDVLTDQADLTTTHRDCTTMTCGECTVLMDGSCVRACAVTVGQAAGRKITTVEGLAPQGQMLPVQLAFLDKDVFSCAHCGPYRAMSAVKLIAGGRADSFARVTGWLRHNRCRCPERRPVRSRPRRAAEG
ncbi:(2Fe-2S)-binding protein [Streptomyces catenulae]|uniref:2Fe-2S iron-sulfur cluster-binding protein n=1 Tax=Streptomyces catenulae TaxID=66875 RepID=A0ABV2Z2Z7_9ACTN|nr:2Fe-2S iron-sulfur cluster-binding protein [Streptomyces catenulae]